MPLEEYKRKRSFTKTPEPTGGTTSKNELHFVIQKHAASHLHYDFRLELQGVLKSWAVPKGPSLNPEIKRLAMLVEDHPYDYKDFEGIIPKGNYGAGTVIIWDEGTYEPVEQAATKKEQEKILLKGLYSGNLKIRMHGHKLKGEFALVRTKGRGENAWLLIKHKDSYSRKADITLSDKSVISNKNLEQMAARKTAAKWESNRNSDGSLKQSVINVSKGKKTSMPGKISPMLCTLTKEILDDDEYLYEIKWDGYRIISYVNKSKVRMDSRSSLDYTKKYPPVATALKKLKRNAVLDGEVVVFNEQGLPDFDALQKYNGHNTSISYCLFDILWLDGYNLMELPLTDRKELLRSLVSPEDAVLRISETFSDGRRLYEEMVNRGLEGVIAKKKDSAYRQGERGNEWLKTPTRKRQEFVIGGWADSDRGRSFRSLLFGAYNSQGSLEWIGRSGGGYKDKEMPGILKQLKALEVNVNPFVNKVLDTKGANIHWVRPKLVANFEFATWTKSGRIRKPATFLGFRKDKKPSEVVREVPRDTAVIEHEIDHEHQKPATQKAGVKAGRKRTKLSSMPGSNWPDLEVISIENEQDFDIGDCNIKISNIDRLVWKGVTKAALIQYYHTIAPYLLPYLKDRPLSLHVKPRGATAPGLYIKDMEGRQPDCAEIFQDKRRHDKADKRSIIDYLVCNNEATLLYMINLGCIDVNPWMSRTHSPQHPDFINIDLDPSDGDFEKVIKVAQAAKAVLSKWKLKSVVKTSGKTGLHIYIPVNGISYKQARQASEMLGREILSIVPDIATTNVSKSQRGDKVFIDPSQNDYADTLAAPYSARPNTTPTVSAPLSWMEVKKGLNPGQFTIFNMTQRIKKKGDLFKDVFNPAWVKHNSVMLEKKILL